MEQILGVDLVLSEDFAKEFELEEVEEDGEAVGSAIGFFHLIIILSWNQEVKSDYQALNF